MNLTLRTLYLLAAATPWCLAQGTVTPANLPQPQAPVSHPAKVSDGQGQDRIITLPPPTLKGRHSIEEGFNARRSTRDFTEDALKLKDVSQILWAAQGITLKREKPSSFWMAKYEDQGGFRTVPSAGALFPIELYLIARNIEGIGKGVYKYHPKTHSIRKVADEDKTLALYEVSLKQSAIKMSQGVLIITGTVERPEAKYKERAERYTFIEVGAVCQNVYLQCGSLGLGTVMIGAFNDQQVKEVLRLPAEEAPLGIMPIGVPKTK